VQTTRSAKERGEVLVIKEKPIWKALLSIAASVLDTDVA
jgi:hypothetical protein